MVWEPHAGILRAREATLATVEAAERAGVRLVREPAAPGSVDGDLVVWPAAPGSRASSTFRSE